MCGAMRQFRSGELARRPHVAIAKVFRTGSLERPSSSRLELHAHAQSENQADAAGRAQAESAQISIARMAR